MIKLNFLQYNQLKLEIKNNYSLDSLVSNFEFETLCQKLLNDFNFKKLKTFSFSKSGFLSLLLELKGKIAISKGESLALIEASKQYESLGFEVSYLELNKDGSVDFTNIKTKNFDYIFISSYVMDTFLKTDLETLKNLTKAKIISNASADFSSFSDAVYFDNYKLSGYFLSSVLLFNNELFSQEFIGFTDTLAIYLVVEALKKRDNNLSIKEIFLEKLENKFKDDLYYFVDNSQTLNNSFHMALKNIKAKELIRTLAFEKIYLSNGEGCSLGLSKPSRVIQEMGYEEIISRNALSFSFNENFSIPIIDKTIDTIYKKYKQLMSFN